MMFGIILSRKTYYVLGVIILSSNKKEGIIEEIYSSEIPYFAVSNQIHIEIYSNRRLVADGYFSVKEYTSEVIMLKLKKGMLEVYGENLCINSVNTENISISGKINRIEFAE